MVSTPDIHKDNWYRFGKPDSGEDEVVFDPDVDEVEEDCYDDPPEDWLTFALEASLANDSLG